MTFNKHICMTIIHKAFQVPGTPKLLELRLRPVQCFVELGQGSSAMLIKCISRQAAQVTDLLFQLCLPRNERAAPYKQRLNTLGFILQTFLYLGLGLGNPEEWEHPFQATT